MPTNTVNLALPKELLQEVDNLAGEEKRSRSELVREALVRLVRSRKNWDWAITQMRGRARKAGITPEDIQEQIQEVRRLDPRRR